MREKLIELIDAVLLYLPWGEVTPHTAEDIADRIIDSGICDESKWIPVTERLPDCADTVLAVDRDGTRSTAYYAGYWHSGGDLDEDAVTHWMELPEPPKGERLWLKSKNSQPRPVLIAYTKVLAGYGQMEDLFLMLPPHNAQTTRPSRKAEHTFAECWTSESESRPTQTASGR